MDEDSWINLLKAMELAKSKLDPKEERKKFTLPNERVYNI
jgi:hypothetical protein